MKYKLWVSPEGLPFLKDWHGVGKILKVHTIRAWACNKEPKKSDKICMSFGRKENEDAGFCISCSVSAAKSIIEQLHAAIKRVE